MMLFDESSIPESLRIQLSGFLPPGKSHSRKMRFEEIYESLPKDASVRVGVYTSEIAPGPSDDRVQGDHPALPGRRRLCRTNRGAPSSGESRTRDPILLRRLRGDAKGSRTRCKCERTLVKRRTSRTIKFAPKRCIHDVSGLTLAFTRPKPLLLRSRLDGLHANPRGDRGGRDRGSHRDDRFRAARPRQTSHLHCSASACHAYPDLSPRRGLLAVHS